MNALLALALLLADFAHATDPRVGTLTRLEGKAALFSHASASLEGPPPRALFQGIYFTVRPARIGDSIASGDMIRVAPGSRGRVVYPNGDQVQLAPGTEVRFLWPENTSEPTVSELHHGRIRAIIENGGPRTRYRVKTRAAVIGVRGTDFTIGDRASRTEVTVMLGEVELAGKGVPRDARVGAGSTARIAAVASTPSPPPLPSPAPASGIEHPVSKSAPPVAFEILPTSRQTLHGILRSTEMTAPARDTLNAPIATLEAKARERIIQEIQRHRPEMNALIPTTETDPATALLRTEASRAPSRPADLEPEEDRLREEEDSAFGGS